VLQGAGEFLVFWRYQLLVCGEVSHEDYQSWYPTPGHVLGGLKPAPTTMCS
jgi:hypothetical protein